MPKDIKPEQIGIATLVIKGLTLAQAKCFVSWFAGQGEQDCTEWFETQNLESPNTHIGRKGGWKEVDKATETVTMHCYTP